MPTSISIPNTAAATKFTPSGTISASDMQAAIAEAVAEALQKSENLSDLANIATSRANLVAAKSGANSDITSIAGLTTALTVGQGGTGMVALPHLLAGNGYKNLVRGGYLEWGSVVVALNANGDGLITLPLTFPVSFFTGIVSNGDPGVFPDRVFATNTSSSTASSLAFSVRPSPGATNVRANFLAVGA